MMPGRENAEQPEPPAPPGWPTLLRALRVAAGATQEGWASRLGVGRRTVQRWEQGGAVPDAATEAALVSLCTARKLFQRYPSGPLRGLSLTPELLQSRLAEARLAVARTPEQAAAGQAAWRHLPVRLSSFVGREAELERVVALLKAARLLTLTGPGGTGKTRLAVAAAERVAESFSDGVWFVDLSAVADPGGLQLGVARALGVSEGEGMTLAASLGAYLRARNILLILDNFEHVVGAAPVLRDLLSEAPGLGLLVTSRVLLNVEGEQAFAVPPLPVPEADRTADGEALRHNPAVRLFVERARALQPDFRLTDENAAVVAAICARLDGLPLAIELAAARLKLLPPPSLLARLDHRLQLLASSDPTLPPRQRTLRATLAWSWNLLPAPEQTLFRRLAVFAGGWTLEAAEGVCGEGGDLLDGLASLIDKSLVRQTELDGEPRFSMLATLREFALEQLELSGEAEEIDRRHAGYYCVFAEGADARRWRSGRLQADLLGPFDREHDNLLAALQWVVQRGETALALRLAGALGVWFFIRAPREGRLRLGQTLSLAGASEPGLARAIALWAAAACASALGETQAMVAHLEEAATLFRAVHDAPWLARTLAVQATYLPEAERARVRALSDEALVLARSAGSAYDIAYVELFAGMAQIAHGGDLATARTHLEAALDRGRALEADWLTLHSLFNLTSLSQSAAQPEATERQWQEVRTRAERFGSRWEAACASVYLALQAGVAGDAARAVTEWRHGLSAARQVGSRTFSAICLAGLAGDLVRLGLPDCAARLLGAVHAIWDDREVAEYYRRLLARAYEPALAATQAALTPEAFARSWSEGRHLTLDQAGTIALEAVRPADSPSRPTSPRLVEFVTPQGAHRRTGRNRLGA